MGKHSDQRDRTLCLARILYEQTDEKHPLTTNRLLRMLAEVGLSAERKSIYRDMAAMSKWGLPVGYLPGKRGGWYLALRPLGQEALQMVIDAVGVYPWVSQEQRGQVLDQLARLSPRHQRRQMRRPVALPPQGGQDPAVVRQALDRVHGALQEGRALSFYALDYQLGKGWQPGDLLMVVTPKGLLWYQGHYHLLGWDHRAGALGLYRLDHMAQPKVTGVPAQGPAAEPERMLAAPFGMDPRRRERICLRCAPALAVDVLDHLGPGAQLRAEEGSFTVTAEVIVGPEFWGWLTAHGDQATVVGPAWAAALWNARYRPRLGQAVGSGQEERQVI